MDQDRYASLSCMVIHLEKNAVNDGDLRKWILNLESWEIFLKGCKESASKSGWIIWKKWMCRLVGSCSRESFLSIEYSNQWLLKIQLLISFCKIMHEVYRELKMRAPWRLQIAHRVTQNKRPKWLIYKEVTYSYMKQPDPRSSLPAGALQRSVYRWLYGLGLEKCGVLLCDPHLPWPESDIHSENVDSFMLPKLTWEEYDHGNLSVEHQS